MKMRKLGVAVVLAGLMASGMVGTAKLQAAKGGISGPPPPSGGGGSTICSVLQTTYSSLDPTSILAQLVLIAMNSLGC